MQLARSRWRRSLDHKWRNTSDISSRVEREPTRVLKTMGRSTLPLQLTPWCLHSSHDGGGSSVSGRVRIREADRPARQMLLARAEHATAAKRCFLPRRSGCVGSNIGSCNWATRKDGIPCANNQPQQHFLGVMAPVFITRRHDFGGSQRAGLELA